MGGGVFSALGRAVHYNPMPQSQSAASQGALDGGHRSLEDGMADGCTEGLLDPARASRMHSQVI